MKVTLLGSGDAIGIPAPMCDCEYCMESDRRRRSGLLVETEDTTLVLDISPDIKEQLHHENIFDVDAFLVTHFHYDHFWGIQELNHIVLPDDRQVFNPEDFDYNGYHNRELEIYGNEKTKEELEENHKPFTNFENIHFHEVGRNEKFEIGDVTVETFGIDHGNDDDVNQGYVVQKNGKKVVYAPDSWELKESEAYHNADIFFAEGQLFKAEGHANQEVLEEQLEKVNPDRIVLLSVTEHLNQMHTEELKEAAEEKGYEVWSDFESTEL